MAELTLRNESAREFVDISSERVRVYIFLGAGRIEINLPQWLSRSASGHYIVDGLGRVHFIPLGWHQLYWEPRADAPHIVL